MKTAIIPQVRVEPELRSQLTAVLKPGETLSEFVEMSVRNAIEFRTVQSRFQTQGQAAWDAYQQVGVAVPADVVLKKVRAKIQAKRRQLQK